MGSFNPEAGRRILIRRKVVEWAQTQIRFFTQHALHRRPPWLVACSARRLSIRQQMLPAYLVACLEDDMADESPLKFDRTKRMTFNPYALGFALPTGIPGHATAHPLAVDAAEQAHATQAAKGPAPMTFPQAVASLFGK